jgi:hypothetical protein
VHGRDQQEERDCSEDDGNPEPLEPVDGPAAECLRRESPPALVQIAAPERERRVHDGLDDDDERGEDERGCPPGPAVYEPVESVARPPEAQQAQDQQSEGDSEHADDVDRTVIATCSLDLRGGENLFAGD